MRKLQGLALGVALITGQFAVAQEKTNAQGNPLSLRPVNDANVMYKVTLWRKIDLREKMNQPFFAKGNEITKHLIEGVKAGVLDAYANDSLVTKLTLEQFSERLQIKEESSGLSKEEREAGFTDAPTSDDGWGGGGDSTSKNDGFGNKTVMPSGATEYFPNQLTTLELREDWLFDKQRSRQYYDIQSLGIVIPAAQTALGFDRAVAYFKFKDLDRYFRSNPKCIWYNAANTAQHKNLADAFELRFFRGRITKKSNAADRDLDDIYKSAREGLLKSEQLENELMELEHNLWEY
ncbi:MULTISPECIES: gliding motility protein GldN [Emticicia]|uniref:type IX secretion system ring protein PorN/GldN n=1 Tax=Emticicia TaxID=312278 RepID=UPI000C781E50|nr:MULTISPECIES: gliding motility protein GldN [Emticicia]PLK44087.1 gliding motility protein GldN [Emticicia sp. TH156]UTA68610.1 gliding motility protein GldN [Emticicia sp. 21SJ11W-3]